MSGIVLSSSVRQNLLSLQSTADLLATTQNRLATGKKVNTALDNPTNFFTAAVARCARRRHQQSAGRHRQRRAGPAGRQHRHHLAAEAGRLPRSRSPTRRCRARSVIRPSRTSPPTITGATADDLVGDQSYTSLPRSQGAAAPQRAGASSAATRSTARSPAGWQRPPPRCRHRREPLATLTLSARPAPAPLRPTAIAAADTLTVNGKTITFEAGSTASSVRAPPITARASTTSLTDLARRSIPCRATQDLRRNASRGDRAASSPLKTGTALQPRGVAGIAPACSPTLGISAAAANTGVRTGGAVSAGPLAGATKLTVGDAPLLRCRTASRCGDTAHASTARR